MTCPVCGASPLVSAGATERVRVRRCRACGHRVAEHALAASAEDYHRQYDQGAFLDALAETRRRQAGVLLRLLRAHLAAPDRLLDFGAGRGWFLEACREAGLARLAGADISPLAVNSLRERGFEAVTVEPPGAGEWSPDLSGLSFRPRVLSLIHVAEHFPAERSADMLAALARALQPDLEMVILMVPRGAGLLYRGAAALNRAGLRGPFEQLYQVGTFPPHFSYFSDRSMERTLERAGLGLVARASDPDFEPARLPARARALGRLPGPVATGLGWTARAAARALGMHDAGIYLAAPSSSGTSSASSMRGTIV